MRLGQEPDKNFRLAKQLSHVAELRVALGADDTDPVEIIMSIEMDFTKLIGSNKDGKPKEVEALGEVQTKSSDQSPGETC